MLLEKGRFIQQDEPFETIKFEMKQVVLYTDEKTLQTITSRVAIEITKLDITNQAEEQEEKDITTMLNILAFHKRLSTNKWKDLCKAQNVPVRQFSRLTQVVAMKEQVRFTPSPKTGIADTWEIVEPYTPYTPITN